MSELTKDSTILELGREAPGTRLCNALMSDSNQELLAERNMRSVGDLLTPEGELALFRLAGTGRRTMSVLHSFLYEKGFSPDWPHTEAMRLDPASRLSRTLNLTRALEEADHQYAMKR
jgi:hypothetical protein